MTKLQLITKGLVKDNPTFVLILGMCPTLATTSSAINGLSMGLATLFVLILSNIVISAIAPAVPDKVHIPVYIVVIATFVTVLQLLMQAYVPAVYATLGLFIPLIVVNCIVLGRAEAFANKNGIIDSALDGLGVGLGFTVSLTVIGLVREILGNGSVFGFKFIDGDGILAFIMAPGAFLVLGYLMVLFNKFLKK
ncbi:MAG: electron transport complex subunit E [Candidatus Cryptobacteroides sp.]|jgi:electron transport complex protein RnfE|nr:electron transport complex subunit E [Bacteroides sp.]MDY5302561.1 electron transport complex subunit E [Candidatus Cryptobacteroides sp.]MCI7196585.1 electron transport complex subunit E [Bacteroides sp.]MCI7548027.1 electron transport complex subunit E [Bacteroides sp.]MCI7663421.1 electron transport complex subunit E [Bacteroides sp.]